MHANTWNTVYLQTLVIIMSQWFTSEVLLYKSCIDCTVLMQFTYRDTVNQKSQDMTRVPLQRTQLEKAFREARLACGSYHSLVIVQLKAVYSLSLSKRPSWVFVSNNQWIMNSPDMIAKRFAASVKPLCGWIHTPVHLPKIESRILFGILCIRDAKQ